MLDELKKKLSAEEVENLLVITNKLIAREMVSPLEMQYARNIMGQKMFSDMLETFKKEREEKEKNIKSVMYCEFIKQDYYAIVSVEFETSIEDAKLKASEIYLDKVAGDTLEEVLEEGEPRVIAESYAYYRFLTLKEHQKDTVGYVTKMFKEIKNDVVIIDGSLV